MTIHVDIGDRLYDYTDEEKAAEAIADFQSRTGMDDDSIMSLWLDDSDPRRSELERLIFNAVDQNGTVKRAQEHVPGDIFLAIQEDVSSL